MITCRVCAGIGKRRSRTFLERLVNRAKLQCPDCGAFWYWRRVLFQKYTFCPECGTSRLSKRSKYDRIDRKSDSVVRRFLGIFGAPIYHCTFCRLQFRDYRRLDPKRRSKVQASA
jgi:ribosomal protein S27AE